MSSRKSSFSREGLPPSKHAERAPLRSLENEALRLSTPSSRRKSSADAVETTKAHFSSSPSSQVVQTSVPTNEVAIACGLGDVTFKSFVCPGGEVEISESSVCADQSIVLSDDQAACNTETEDTIISDSMIVQSYGDHVDHPYYTPEMMDKSSVAAEEACLTENPSPTQPTGSVADDHTAKDSGAFQNDLCGEKDVATPHETIPPLQAQLDESSQDNSVNAPELSDNSRLCQTEHADHPDCMGLTAPAVATYSGTPDGFEKCASVLTDVTFKSFNCTGGEIEICEGTALLNETVSLPLDYIVTGSVPCSYSVEQSILAADHELQSGNEHLEHPYFDSDRCSPASGSNLSFVQEPLPCSPTIGEDNQISCLVVPGNQTDGPEHATLGSFVKADDGVEMSQTSPQPEDRAVICQSLGDHAEAACVTQRQIRGDSEPANCHVENDEVLATHPPAFHAPPEPVGDESVACQVQETPKHSQVHPGDSALPSLLRQTQSSDCSESVASAKSPTRPVDVQQNPQHVPQTHASSGPSESSEAKDSAFSSSGTIPALWNSAENLQVENLTDVLKALSECPSVASAFQLGFFSPVVRRASQSVFKANYGPALDNYLADDSALESEKSLVAPVSSDISGLWADHLESPLPRPLFNSTALGYKPQPGPVTESEKGFGVKPCAVAQVEKPVLDFPLIPDGPLQQQLRQMAEFLILASGKMGPAGVSAAVLPPPPPPPPAPAPAAAAVTVTRAAPVESHSVCVGTSSVQLVDRSLNTSGQFERKRLFSVVDSCTLTEPLLWNVPPGSLEGLPKQELEQRLRSSMIMVEALVQQLSAARACGSSSAGPAPSELREKLVQTDHTELSQTTGYRDLYMEALSRIGDLELDGSSLQNLTQCMQDTRATMTALSSDTDAALSNMKEARDIVREDHQNLLSHYCQMKSLLGKANETQTRTVQKVKDALHQRNDMRTQMEEAVTAKEAAFSAMEQLRTHCAAEMSKLEKSVGSQQELLASLNKVYPEQVGLNQAYVETLNSASALLSATNEEHSTLMKELCAVKGHLLSTAPLLLKLKDKAAAALSERDEHISARDRAVEEREQIEEELTQTHLDLQTAREQIGDLNLQLTILSSEMGVLREKLTERDEEKGQLERKVTELSATVSSTLASYTFLEQALAAETTKLQESWKDIQQSKDRGDELESSLDQSERRVSELTGALGQSEEQLGQLQTLSQSQKMQLQQLQDACTQLGGVREMNEFLQMENELAREQVIESERLLRANLQGLRERNIHCEDLKAELDNLRLENRSLQEQLESTASRASATKLELGEKLAQAVTEITLLHHTLRGLTNELRAALDDETAETQKDKETPSVVHSERRHPSSSFVDSIMVALTTETEEDDQSETPPGPVRVEMPESQSDTLFSENSAFTRIPITPKKSLNPAIDFELEEDDQSCVAELLGGLGATVTELSSVLKLVQQRRGALLEELRGTISGLQEEQQTARGRQEAEVSELKHQLSGLKVLAERGSQALQHKAQDEKTVTKLSGEIQDIQEFLNRLKTDNNELRKEVMELRRSLQQSKAESKYLHEELRKAGDVSAKPAHFMEEKLQLLREVERLKLSLQELEQARVKLLERAKRHQMIHQSNQQKSENELQMLNNMINKVRETLMSLPNIVKNCAPLQQLVEYIG